MTRFLKWYRELILPAGLLSALIVGAGMFALPYVFSEAGVLIGLFYLIIFTVVISLVHLFYLQLLTATPGEHRFVGLARIYLGENGFRLSILTTLIGIFLVLTIYLILSISFSKIVFPEYPPINGLLIFWFLGTVAIFSPLKRLSGLEFLVTLAMAVIVLLLFIGGLQGVSSKEIIAVNWNSFFLPYGVVLFALYGRSGISSLLEYYKTNNLNQSKAKGAIVLGTAFPALVYLLFIFGVIGLSSKVSVDAVSGIAISPSIITNLIGILGLLAILTSYIFLGLEVKGILRYDFGWPGFLNFLSVGFLPLTLYLIGFQNFLDLISLTGGIFLGLEGLMVILMWQKIIKRNPLSYALIILLLLGVLYEIVKVFYNWP